MKLDKFGARPPQKRKDRLPLRCLSEFARELNMTTYQLMGHWSRSAIERPAPVFNTHVTKKGGGQQNVPYYYKHELTKWWEDYQQQLME